MDFVGCELIGIDSFYADLKADIKEDYAMDTPTLVTIMFAAAVLFFLTISRKTKAKEPEKPGFVDGPDANSGQKICNHKADSELVSARLLGPRQNTRQRVMSDEDKLELERLIHFEKQRMPSASLEHCLAAAIARFESGKR